MLASVTAGQLAGTGKLAGSLASLASELLVRQLLDAWPAGQPGYIRKLCTNTRRNFFNLYGVEVARPTQLPIVANSGHGRGHALRPRPKDTA